MTPIITVGDILLVKTRIIWEDNPGYRDQKAEIGDYLMMVVGGRAHEFGWVIFYKKNELESSKKGDPCRSVHEAKRILESIYRMHSNHLTQLGG